MRRLNRRKLASASAISVAANAKIQRSRKLRQKRSDSVMDPIFQGCVRNGQIYLETPSRFAKLKDTLEGQQVDLVLRKHRKKRSNPQNAYFHGVVLKIFAEFLGYEPEELKDALKFKFLRTHTDGDLPGVRRTRDLNTAEFTEFVEQVRRLAAEMGLDIPSPNEVEWDLGVSEQDMPGERE